MAVPVTRCSRDLRYLWANPAYARFLQRPLDQIVGRPIVEVLGRELFEKLRPHFKRVLAGERVDYEQESNVPGIGNKWVSVTYTPTFDADGVANGWVKVVIDITQRKRVEEALRESEERFRLATEAGKMFAYQWDAATDTLVRSGDCSPILGLTEAEPFTGTQAFSKVHPDDRERLLAAMGKLSPEKPNLQVSYRMVRPDGTVIWIDRNSKAYFDEQGNILRITGMVADVTQRRLAEEALRKSEERFRLAAQAGRMYAYEWDLGTDVLVRSSEYAQILGLTEPSRFTRLEFLEKIHPDDRPEFLAAVSALTPQNPTQDVTYRFLTPRGELVWLKNSGRGFFDEKGNLVRVIGMVADVTTQKLAEEALSDVSGKLLQAQEDERVRIARELHDDIVQRLALLSVGLDQAQKQVRDAPAEAVQLLLELQTQMIEVSSDLQAVSRELHSSALEHLGLLQAARGWCAQFSERQQIEIDFSGELPNSPPYEISLCVLRVLQEALHNACKHSQVKRIEVRLWESSGEVHLLVKDLGRGFDVAAASPDRGLGLTSMRERVRLVNGSIAIESKPMRGTTLHACVPLLSSKVQQQKA